MLNNTDINRIDISSHPLADCHVDTSLDVAVEDAPKHRASIAPPRITVMRHQTDSLPENRKTTNQTELSDNNVMEMAVTEMTMDTRRMIELVRDAQAGDREAFGELVSMFQSTVYWTVMKRVRNTSEASELTQEVFMQALRKLPQLRELERFAGWLRQIAVRMSINRMTRRPQETTCLSDNCSGVESESTGPLEDLLREEQASHIRESLGRLREIDRQTLIAFYFKGHSLKEMSDEFASPVGTIKRRLHMARNRLRKELSKMQTA